MRVVSYNIRKGKGAHGRSAVDMGRIGTALRSLSPDLLLCQEVFHCSQGGPPQSDGLAEALGFTHFFGPNKYRSVGDHGNTTLTPLPVEHAENHDISTNPVERRGALYLRARMEDGQPLHVFNVHLGLNGFQRSAQISEIAGILERSATSSDPVVLAGDFNDWRKQLEPRVAAMGLTSVFSDRDADTPRTWHARRPVFPLDRIYVRNLRVKNAGSVDGEPWNALSDHLPLWAELTTAG